ncbi:hypothetical protein NN4_12510 [Nocardia ninae NBRC 108245]|uniref:Uncharacterized protein n=1 Tax=Nocardia ninae NBRC 108245 TaxID=1210091 RepID=A0A511M7X2_9NOCA|nr:hypothetical protein NN4_12510 [Nocardia ninae NBRC 108245]
MGGLIDDEDLPAGLVDHVMVVLDELPARRCRRIDPLQFGFQRILGSAVRSQQLGDLGNALFGEFGRASHLVVLASEVVRGQSTGIQVVVQEILGPHHAVGDVARGLLRGTVGNDPRGVGVHQCFIDLIDHGHPARHHFAAQMTESGVVQSADVDRRFPVCRRHIPFTIRIHPADMKPVGPQHPLVQVECLVGQGVAGGEHLQ